MDGELTGNPGAETRDEFSWTGENTENTGANGNNCGYNKITQTLKVKLPK